MTIPPKKEEASKENHEKGGNEKVGFGKVRNIAIPLQKKKNQLKLLKLVHIAVMLTSFGAPSNVPSKPFLFWVP